MGDGETGVNAHRLISVSRRALAGVSQQSLLNVVSLPNTVNASIGYDPTYDRRRPSTSAINVSERRCYVSCLAIEQLFDAFDRYALARAQLLCED